jgi:hypothetical protein
MGHTVHLLKPSCNESRNGGVIRIQRFFLALSQPAPNKTNHVFFLVLISSLDSLVICLYFMQVFFYLIYLNLNPGLPHIKD